MVDPKCRIHVGVLLLVVLIRNLDPRDLDRPLWKIAGYDFYRFWIWVEPCARVRNLQIKRPGLLLSYPQLYLSKDVFGFVLVFPPPGWSGRGSGLAFSEGDRGLGADAGPDPGGNIFCI